MHTSAMPTTSLFRTTGSIPSPKPNGTEHLEKALGALSTPSTNPNGTEPLTPPTNGTEHLQKALGALSTPSTNPNGTEPLTPPTNGTEHLEKALGALSIQGGSLQPGSNLETAVSAELGFARHASSPSEGKPPQSLQEGVSTSHEEVQVSDPVSTMNDYARKLIADIMANRWTSSVSLTEAQMSQATLGLKKLLNVFKDSEKVEVFCDYLGLLIQHYCRRDEMDIKMYIHAAEGFRQIELHDNAATCMWHCRTSLAHKLLMDGVVYVLPYE